MREGDWWLRFAAPARIVTADVMDDVATVLGAAETHTARGGWAVGYVAYDAAPAFDASLVSRRGDMPLAWFALYESPPLAYRELRPTRAHIELGCPDTDVATYAERFERVRDALRRGESYQVNLTIRQRFRLASDAHGLFASRCGVDPPPFATFIHGGEWQVASFSPELFFERKGDRIECRPMKGTAPAAAAHEVLTADAKSIAENVMIVDMVRNDLGAIADPGSVVTPKLLRVERHRGLLQMTSTVTAKSSKPTSEIFRHLFPAASVTGSPKVATCRLIAALEASPRGIYCGAVGYMSAARQRFSVAIRTAWIDARSRSGTFGIGSGIVWDSVAAAEYEECLSKRDVLLSEGTPWALIESIPQHALQDHGTVAAHLTRMRRAAGLLEVPMDRRAIEAALADVPSTDPESRMKVRVKLTHDGVFDVECGPSLLRHVPVSAVLASEPVDSTDPNLRIKTTSRSMYDRHLEAHADFDEVLLYNESGQLTEFCRGNVVLRLDGDLVTPDPAVGCLAGVGVGPRIGCGISYARPTLADLQRADAVYFVNSVVGMVDVSMPVASPVSPPAPCADKER